ncbi:hypothetical protein [Pseudoflavitalea rhizosphaerae]|uniref:hypothetical protein n=1 Tax=Pseudoflavitalea rhizosphaerae TaxID=1884793 RepID=UPI000F8D1911|nr:hypothetical protein [Pseudoflavitalea rhizosphaerae]
MLAKSQKALQQLAQQEVRLKKKLARKDSLQAEALFGNVEEKYAQLQKQLIIPIDNVSSTGEYLPHLDTLSTSLQFLTAHSNLLPNAQALSAPVQNALHRVNELKGRLHTTEQIQQYLLERQDVLNDQLKRFGYTKEFQRYQQQAYYYKQQVQEYKNLLEDPSRLQEQAIALLQKLPAFRQFLHEHSLLASLFRLPGNYASQVSLAGLQTRSSVQGILQDRISAGGPNAMASFQQNIQDAQGQLAQLKDKLNQLGGGGELDMPDFKPNHQKTKTFLQRLEYGTNLQSQPSSNWFPTTTDLGLSVGYKLNDKSTIGVGASYKVGWGRDIQHIAVTHQGVGLRSFVDVNVKGSFYATGGFEYNYQQPFRSLTDLNGIDKWQESGLVGVSKILSLKSKVFKKTQLQLLWDFLSYRQTPRSQPVKFRVGYRF